MANKLAGGIKAGSTANQLEILLTKSADGLPQTGKLAADLTVSYRRQGAAAVQVTTPTFAALHDLTAITDAWSESGVKESSASLQPGLYRVDYPDAAFLTGADYVVICVQCSGCIPYVEKIPLETQGAAEVFAKVLDAAGTRGAVGLATANLDTQLATLDTDILSRAAPGAAMTLTGGERTAIANALQDLADGVEAGWTPRQLQRQLLGMAAGITAGMDTPTGTVKNPAGTKNRVVAAIDANGNRVPSAWDNS